MHEPRNIKKEFKFFLAFVVLVLVLAVMLKAAKVTSFVSTLRAAFGLAFILFLPGYIALSSFFEEQDLDSYEKTAYSFGISVGLVVLIAVLLDLFWEISGLSVFITLLSLMIIMAVAGQSIRKLKSPY